MTRQSNQPEQSMTIGNPIKVTVSADLDPKSHQVVWDHEWEVQGKPGKHKHAIVVPAGQSDVPIAFHLDDRTGLHLKFYETPSEAIYVGPAPECPKSPGNGGQITFGDKASPNLLKVVDDNSEAGDLKYTLRFDGDVNSAGGQQAPYEYDPDLKNGGAT